MKKLFGTDGMRGKAGHFPINQETMHTTGRSLAHHLTRNLGRAPRLVLGRDTRESGGWIENALIKGAREAGAECDSAGVITTPGVAFLARTLPADAGLVISASHNPYQDNGIKIFAPTGRKLDDAMEKLIEADIYAVAQGAPESSEKHAPQAGKKPSAEANEALTAMLASDEAETATSTEHHTKVADLRARYLNYLVDEVAAGLRFNGLSIAVDCANGAASQFAPELFTRLGARAHAINNVPDGRNINHECGSLHIDGLRRRVVETKAALGVAFDGDADRALFVDARGQFVDGDATLWVMANLMATQGKLDGNCVVATVMSNIGLELALHARGIKLLRTDVGDKYVLEELLRTGAQLGGEQSGHIIFPNVSLAGDGMITTINMLRAMVESRCALHELVEGFVRYPQVLINVRVREKVPFDEVAEIAQRVRETETALGEKGRLLLRYSGTELLARVMVEGQRQGEIESLAQTLAAEIERTLGSL